MVEVKVKIEDTMKQVEDAANKAAFTNQFHAAASLSKDAKASIVKSTNRRAAKYDTSSIKRDSRGKFLAGSGKKRLKQRARQMPSRPGDPPFTVQGQLSRAIVFHSNEESAVIGPRASVVGQVGAAHEFGGVYKGGKYPARPFMGPALDRAIPRFAGRFQGSIGS